MGNTLYLECYSGISGDMTVAALLDLGADQAVLEKTLRSLNVGGFQIEITRVKKSGLDACDFHVVLDEIHENHDHDMKFLHGHDHKHTHGTEHDHEHRGLPEIRRILMESEMTNRAKKIAISIFEILARAEAKAHGVPEEQVHFHEVGAVDSIVDIAAAAVCLDNLDITEVIVPRLCEGVGTVRCQHGILPIPVPAVINIIQQNGLSLNIIDVEGELVTPTGAAIVAAVRTSDCLPGNFKIIKTGIGAGKRKYTCPGILRAMLIQNDTNKEESKYQEKDSIWKLESNIDDCTGEELGNTVRLLFEAGAKDVYHTPIYMKKNRPAYELSVICSEEKIKELEKIIFEETTTIGIRRTCMERTVLNRSQQELLVNGEEVHVKVCTLPDGRYRCYPEYDSVAAFAENNHMSYREAWEEIRSCWNKETLCKKGENENDG